MRDRERDMADEMRLHLEHRIAQKIAQGMAPDEAREAALRDFGNVEALKLTVREQRRLWRAATVWRDIVFGLRILRRSPGFALTAIVTLALGVGANVTVFAVVRGVLLEAPDYPNADRVVHISRHVERLRGHSLTFEDLDRIRNRAPVTERLAASTQTMATLHGEGTPERASIEQVQDEFFDVYGVVPARGRVLGKSDFAPDVRAAVVSDGFWRRQFGGADDVLGKIVRIDDLAFTVVGVMPANFVTDPASRADAEVWVPLPAMAMDRLATRTVARLRPTITAGDAARQLTAILPPKPVELHDGTVLRHLGVRVEPLGSLEAEAARPGVLMLQGVAALLLLIMCANLGNLFLAHASERRREFGVRTALGAGQARLVGQLLTEAAVVAAIGSALAVGIAAVALPRLQSLADSLLPRSASMGVQTPEFAVSLGLSWLTALLFAGIPAWLASRMDPLEVFRGSRHDTAGVGAQVFRKALVFAQVLLALVVLVGSALLVRSFVRVLAQPLGFNEKGLVTGQIEVRPKTSQPRDEALAFARRLEAAMRSRLDASKFNIGGDVPYSIQRNAPFNLIPAGGGASLRNDMAYVRAIDDSALAFFGIRLVRGREFVMTDDGSAPPVALVNEAFVRRFARAGDVIGARLDSGPNRPSRTIVGVVADVRSVALSQEPDAAVYLPFAQWSPPTMFIATRGIPRDEAAQLMREAVRSLDPSLPVTDIGAMEAKILLRERRRGFYLTLLSISAVLAVSLAAVGIYGVVAYLTAARRREMGIRLALGAKPRGLVHLVMRQSLVPVGLGLAVGVLAAWWLAAAMQNNPVLKSQLFGITVHDPATFVAVPAVLLAIALVACWIPARRAASAGVVDVLRAE